MESCCSRNSVPPLSLNWPDVLASFLVLCGRTAMSRSGRATDAEDSTMTDIKRIVPGKRMSQAVRSEEHTSELQSLMRISYAVFCLKKKTHTITQHTYTQ